MGTFLSSTVTCLPSSSHVFRTIFRIREFSGENGTWEGAYLIETSTLMGPCAMLAGFRSESSLVGLEQRMFLLDAH